VVALDELERDALNCTRCRLAEGRTTVVFGEGDPAAGLMVIGEGPGRDEDLQGRPFVGRSGKLLDRLLLEEIGIRRESCYIANVVKCRLPGNRDPLPDEVAACRPWLDSQLGLIRPRVVLTLGNFATRLLLGTSDGIKRLRGRTYSFAGGALAASPAKSEGGQGGQAGQAVIVPTYHPSAALRGAGETLAEMRADFVRAKEALAR
jgi:DNA polymerase